jgi:hypothetical protein
MAKKKRVINPKLHLCAAAWTMQGQPHPNKQWSMDTKLRKVKEAGFVGFSHGADPEANKACKKYGIVHVGGVDVAKVREALPKLKKFKEMGVHHINIQLCDHDTEVKESVPIARAVMKGGEDLGLQPAIEVHRDTCTETPEKTFALADAYEKRYRKKLRINFDHSHPAIIKQVRAPTYWEPKTNARPDLLRAGELIHFRPFTGSHCQTPVTNGKGKIDRDFALWRDHFLSPMLESWLKGAKSGAELYGVVELGPQGSGYALECFPDVWKDACVARVEIQNVWDRLVRKWRRGR